MRRRERGTASLELLGMLPLVLVLGLFVVQLGLVAWTTVATNSAARDGARAAALHRDGCEAARAAVGNSGQAESCAMARDARTATVTVRVRVPVMFSLIPAPSVQRTATMPVAS